MQSSFWSSRGRKASPATIVKHAQPRFVASRPAGKEQPAGNQDQQFMPAVEFDFAQRRDGRMGAKDLHAQPAHPAPPPQPPAEISIFASEHRLIESMKRAKGVAATKDET